jgi:hypothetical protein
MYVLRRGPETTWQGSTNAIPFASRVRVKEVTIMFSDIKDRDVFHFSGLQDWWNVYHSIIMKN